MTKGTRQARSGRSVVRTRISGETLRLLRRVTKRTGETLSAATTRMIQQAYDQRRALYTVDHANPGRVRVHENAVEAAERIESGKARLATHAEMMRVGMLNAI